MVVTPQRERGSRMAPTAGPGLRREEIAIPVRGGEIVGDLAVPPGAIGTVVFAHGSGSGRFSPRNQSVAADLEAAGIATLLLDLLTGPEAEVDEETRQYRFDIPRLAGRLTEAVDRVAAQGPTAGKPAGLYGASTGGAAALITAATRPEAVRALVLRGARSDLAGPAARQVLAPTLFLVGEHDPIVRDLNEATRSEMPGPTELVVVPGASHLFEEPGALEEVSRRARDWFLRHLPAAMPPSSP